MIYIDLVFGKKLNNCLSKNLLYYNLIGYTENNFTKNIKNWKLIMKYYFSLNGVVISEKNKKQRTIFISIIKVKYITFKYVAKKVVWIRQFINKIEFKIIKSIMLYNNNKISIVLTKNIKN